MPLPTSFSLRLILVRCIVRAAVLHLTAAICVLSSGGAAMTISYAGKSAVTDYRSTNVTKSFDVDGDNVYGTAGYVLYGTDVVGNSNAGSVPTTDPLAYSAGTRSTRKSVPAWLTLINNGQNAVASSYDSYPYADDPAATPGTSVPDVQLGYAIRLSTALGTEAPMLNIRFESGRPASGIRIGIICLASGNDAVDYIALTNNSNAGASATRTSAATPFIYFFDVSGAENADVITLRMRKDVSTGGNANLAYIGLTFDTLPGAQGPPVVTLTKPLSNSIYAASLNTTVAADATDTDGTVTNVSFFIGGQKYGDVKTSPFALVWSNIAAGSYVWRAIATDSSGLSATSPAAPVTVVDPRDFRIVGWSRSNSTSVKWQSQPTLRYQVEAASGLSTSTWLPVATNVATSQLSTAAFENLAGQQQFFRIRLDVTSPPTPQVATYPLPACYTASTQLSLTVDSNPVPIIDCSAEFRNYDYCTFSCGGTNLITITASEDIVSYNISPLTSGITAIVSGKSLRFVLPAPQYLIVKINNLRDLVVAADASETNAPPAVGPGIHNIALPPYAADPSGNSIATFPIQSAIDDASRAGGGTVFVPAGVFKCGNLVLKDNVALYLAGGAVIRGTGNPSDFLTRFNKASLGMDGTWFISTAANATNITIYGRGTIDGNGHYMRNSQNYLNNLVVPLQCSGFTVDGVVLRDSGLWSLIVTRSDNVVIRNTKHFNNNDLDYENDAIDVQESQNVLIKHTVAVSEDDTYSVKTWTPTTDIAVNWPGSPEVATNIVFDDCLAWSRTGAFKIGQGLYQPQANISFKNSSVYRCMYAVAVVYKNGSAGAGDITYTNLDIEGFWPRAGNSGRWLYATITSTGSITNLVVARVNVRSPDTIGSALQGLNDTFKFYGVLFKNNTYNGAPGTGLIPLHITNTNSYVTNLVFQ